MASRAIRTVAATAMLAACGGGGGGGGGTAAPPVDAPTDAMRAMVCPHRGTSSITGTGPAGSLGGRHVYAEGVTGFCPDELILIVTAEDPLATPYLDGSAVIRVPLLHTYLGGTDPWSGTFAATLSLPDDIALARGTLVVDSATPGGGGPTQLRATAQIQDGAWHLTATIDAPYCMVTTCL